MNAIDIIISESVVKAVKQLYSFETTIAGVQVAKTRKEFTGDFTVVVFPYTKPAGKSPEQTATEIGEYLKNNISEIYNYNVIKGFLNLEISEQYWISVLNTAIANENFGTKPITTVSNKVMVEYSSPNTNKPLHLGHIRNNLLGFAIANILKANGNKIIKVNLVNDRGIHICKSMLAWQKWGNGVTPESSGIKGDHLVGDYYVKFDKEYKVQINELINSGQTEDDAKKNAPLILEAQEMLRNWEAGNDEVVRIWKMMNSWVYNGFNVTYNTLGVNFDKIYYESETYLLGKQLVLEGLKNGVLYQKTDNSIWADLSDDKLDQKVLLRSDGTSVYMTQDIGTAHQRFTENQIDKHIYVVGNEQDYHFQALTIVLKKLGFEWYNKIKHLSYGMVELPAGKMKSREGTVVDADDLMSEMFDTARQISQELGKLDNLTDAEKEKIVRTIGLGALKYFMLKVDPKKTMMFDPKESVDFNGNTGPFIQYTYARIQSMLRKAAELNINLMPINEKVNFLNIKEIELIKSIYDFPVIINEAAQNMSPALVANYCYELVKQYNQFYHEYSVIKEENTDIRNMRLSLSKKTGEIIKISMGLLGIDVPERM